MEDTSIHIMTAITHSPKDSGSQKVEDHPSRNSADARSLTWQLCVVRGPDSFHPVALPLLER